MSKVRWREGSEVTVREAGQGGPTVLLAHGAGTDQDHPLVAGLREALGAVGLKAISFNYPYTEEGRRRPDRQQVLMDCHRAIADWARATFGGPLVLAGRSMGGRIATLIAADGHPVDALVLYAYPLHPAGKPDKLRFDHLPGIEAPMLFFQGSRDPLSRPELFDALVRPIATVHDLPGADHSFRIKGTTRDELNSLLAQETQRWLRVLFADRS